MNTTFESESSFATSPRSAHDFRICGSLAPTPSTSSGMSPSASQKELSFPLSCLLHDTLDFRHFPYWQLFEFFPLLVNSRLRTRSCHCLVYQNTLVHTLIVTRNKIFMISGLSLSKCDLVDSWASMIQTYLVRRELCFVLLYLSVLSTNLATNCELKLPFQHFAPVFHGVLQQPNATSCALCGSCPFEVALEI